LASVETDDQAVVGDRPSIGSASPEFQPAMSCSYKLLTASSASMGSAVILTRSIELKRAPALGFPRRRRGQSQRVALLAIVLGILAVLVFVAAALALAKKRRAGQRPTGSPPQ
jgi:hypothetical protein